VRLDARSTQSLTYQLRLALEPQSDPAVDATEDNADSRRLHQRHSDHILDMMRAGISMRTIRRHRLDDPRLTDEVRALLVEAAKERQSKAWFRWPEDQRNQDRLATLIRLGPIVRHTASVGTGSESPETCARASAAVPDSKPLKEVIQANPSNSMRALLPAGNARSGAHSLQQSACICSPATACDVYRQAADGSVAAGNRQTVRR
jgi:hypothetical protein